MNRGTATSDGHLQWQRDSSGSQKPPGVKMGMPFYELKTKCLKEKQRNKELLFEDPEFPDDDSLLYYKIRPGLEGGPSSSYEWKRPRDIVKKILGLDENPEFFVHGACLFDVRQYLLGDCWMLASMSCLSMHDDLMKKVVPDGQSFKDGEYAGIFRFNLWKFGEWVEVIIDDRLPTNERGLVYTSSSDKNEFWTALLEKAYAKFYGSYINIVGGAAKNALEDFTGGIGETVDMTARDPSRNLWNIMLKAQERKSLMCCSTETTNPKVKFLKNGLVSEHAYSVTAVVSVNTKDYGNVEIVRVRNPWGDDDENKDRWKGEWRDSSPKWAPLSQSEKNLIGYDYNLTNGEFCMSFKEFEESFVKLHICHLDPNSFTDDAGVGQQKGKRWEVKSIKDRWEKGINAGGYDKYLNSQTFLTNPQYPFEVVYPDEGDSKGNGTVIIALMQRERKREHCDLQIGYAISKLQNPEDKKFDSRHVLENVIEFSEQREICRRYYLPRGRYCVVFFTKLAGVEGDFILRIFSEKPLNSEEFVEPTGKVDSSKGLLLNTVLNLDISGGKFPRNENTSQKKRQPEVKPASDGSKTCQKMWEAFQKKSGETKTLDAWDLKKILEAEFTPGFKFEGFSDATCWSLVELKQAGRSSLFGYKEFVEIWTLLQKWKEAFMKYDRDGNGTFDSSELREAMHYIGYSVSNGTFTTLVKNYSKNSRIHFDDFVRGMAHLSKKLEEYRDSNFSLTLEEFIQKNI